MPTRQSLKSILIASCLFAPAPVLAKDVRILASDEDKNMQIKVRGRVQLDAAGVDLPDGVPQDNTGFRTEVRRAYIGVDGKIASNWKFRVEADLAPDKVEITDLYLAYDVTDALQIGIGQIKPFWGLEEVTSDLFPSFTERAAINTSLGFERRLGVGLTYSKNDILLQGGVFKVNLLELDDPKAEYSLDGRVVYMPKVGDAQLHLGGSVHFRELREGNESIRYRSRPFVHTTDIRLVDTGSFDAKSDLGIALEAAVIKGQFHAAAEGRWQSVDRPGEPNPTFFGGYVEAGYFITNGDKRGYSPGAFDRIKPARPVSKGGPGAIQVNARYDYLDLTDAGIMGGRQIGYEVSLIWTPESKLRFIMNYGRLQFKDAAVPAEGGDGNYGADAFGMRAQFDF